MWSWAGASAFSVAEYGHGLTYLWDSQVTDPVFTQRKRAGLGSVYQCKPACESTPKQLKRNREQQLVPQASSYSSLQMLQHISQNTILLE